MTEVVWPKFFSGMTLPVDRIVVLARKIVANNGLSHVNLIVTTGISFLPKVLVGLGLFPSANQVRKNRPACFRDIVSGETVKVGRVNITVLPEKEGLCVS